jgi:hypothetical protein
MQQSQAILLTIGGPSCKATGNIDPYSVLVVHNATNIAHGCMYKEFLLFAQLPPLLRIGIWQGTRVAEHRHSFDIYVTYTRNMHLGALPQIRPSQVTI